jgi:hypothetical protein
MAHLLATYVRTSPAATAMTVIIAGILGRRCPVAVPVAD